MGLVNFIDFNTDKSTALSVRTSPIIKFHEFNGVQLLPNNPFPYIQTTNVSGGIFLEDWEVLVVDLCTEQETDITDYFTVERVFQDTNGQSQFDWSIKNVPFDFGYKMVYLKVNQLIGETFYSNPFNFTDYKSEKTCRLDYKSKSSDTMQSVQVQMYFWQQLKQTEINSYYEVSTRNTVTTLVKSQKFERWATDFIPNHIMIKIDDVFENKFVYVDLERANLFEANEIKEFTAEENFKSNNVKIAFNKSDAYDPLYVEPINALIPRITLNSVVPNGINAIYSFGFENFTPTYLTFQTSQDQVTWNSTNKGITSSQSIPFTGVNVWYFRIIHPEAQSNVIQLDLGSNVIANNDSSEVPKGGTIDIPVLFNDTLVGTTLITNVSAPANGTANIIEGGTKIRYTNNNTDAGFDTFTYTISNGITSDTATVNITVNGIVTLTPFLMSKIGDDIKSTACVFVLNQTRYYSGSTIISTGSYIYSADSILAPFPGAFKYYAILGGKVIQIDDDGKVIEIYLC